MTIDLSGYKLRTVKHDCQQYGNEERVSSAITVATALMPDHISINGVNVHLRELILAINQVNEPSLTKLYQLPA